MNRRFEPRFNEDGTWNRIGAHKYAAILELDKKLTENEIPHILEPLMDGWIICYFNPEGERVGDVIEHCGSYGHEEDLMEAMDFDLEDVKGWLTVEEAFTFFKYAHEQTME